MLKEIKQAVTYIKKKSDLKPVIGLVLGSGLGVMADEIKETDIITYEEIPKFPISTVDGHPGNLVLGKLEEKTVIAMQGRFHYYEGYSMEEVTFPIRVMKLMGINILILTNAAGGINCNFSPGDFMLITDHLNLTGSNPLIGKNDDRLGPRFPDLTEAYSRRLISLTEEEAKKNNLMIRKGVYAALSGPTYETPAEIRYLASIGADAVGMSTVPETIVARHMGIEVLGISCITNMAAGILPVPLSHQDVIDTAEKVRPDFIKLLQSIIKNVSY